MRNAQRVVEKEGLTGLPLINPLHRFLVHQRLILHRLHVSNDVILLHDGADVPRVREAIEVIKPQARSARRSSLHRVALPFRSLAYHHHPIHAEVPLAHASIVYP